MVTIEDLRTSHPQQAQLDAESAKMLKRAWDACVICGEPIAGRRILDWRVCNGCYGAARRILLRLVRQEQGLDGG